jgi:hypothetical protein
MVLSREETRRLSFLSIRFPKGISRSAKIIAVTNGARKSLASAKPVKRKKAPTRRATKG